MVIYLVLPSPAGSSDLPESRSGKSVAFYSVLLRMGFTYAPSVTGQAVVSYTALPPFTRQNMAVHFCCTILGVTSTGRYPASCPVKPGLSSPVPFRVLRLTAATIYLTCHGHFNSIFPAWQGEILSVASMSATAFMRFRTLVPFSDAEAAASDKLPHNRIFSANSRC